MPEGVRTGAFLADVIAGAIDGGIRPAARDAFEAWVTKIRQELGVATTPDNIDQLVLASPDRLAKALAAASQQEAAYRRARDWAELDASGLTFPWDTDARLYVLMILQRYSAVRPAERILENYRELIDLFGEQPVLAAAERVRAVPRGADGLLARAPAPGVASRSPDAAFTEILATQSGDTYFKYLLWQGAGGLSRSPAEARREYDRFVWSYGASAVDAVATTVLDLPKDQFGNISPDTISRLQVPPGKHAAIWTLLERRDPQVRVRAMFAFHPEAKSSGDVERLRRALVERYGEQRVTEATQSLHEFWHGAAAHEPSSLMGRVRGDFFGWNRNGPFPGHLTLTASSDSLMAGSLKATVIMSDRSERPFEVHFRAERGTGCGGR